MSGFIGQRLYEKEDRCKTPPRSDRPPYSPLGDRGMFSAKKFNLFFAGEEIIHRGINAGNSSQRKEWMIVGFQLIFCSLLVANDCGWQKAIFPLGVRSRNLLQEPTGKLWAKSRHRPHIKAFLFYSSLCQPSGASGPKFFQRLGFISLNLCFA
jgi:hypothetical protein